MLNMSSISAVSWPTPVATAVAPVVPVAAVQPVQASGGSDGQTQAGFGREGRSTPQQHHSAAGRSGTESRTPTEAPPPALPRDPDTMPKAPAPQDAGAQRLARQAAAQAAEQEKAKDRQAIEHLQTVLSNMWEASAAVVDRALGREPGNTDAPGNQSDTAPDLSQVAASTIPRKPLLPDRQASQPALEPLPWPIMPEGVEGEAAAEVAPAIESRSSGGVVAYDERGNSSLAPLEAGSLISHRV